jgi:hypothetical protein
MKANPDEFQALAIGKLEAQWAEPVSLTFHSALRKLNTERSNCLFLNFQLLYQYYQLHVQECCRLHSYKVCCFKIIETGIRPK